MVTLSDLRSSLFLGCRVVTSSDLRSSLLFWGCLVGTLSDLRSLLLFCGDLAVITGAPPVVVVGF